MMIIYVGGDNDNEKREMLKKEISDLHKEELSLLFNTACNFAELSKVQDLIDKKKEQLKMLTD